MGNYTRDQWDEVAEEALDDQACHIGVHHEYETFEGLDRAMDQLQERAYRSLRYVAEHSSDSKAREMVREALRCLAEAERLESEVEASVQAMDEAVERGDGHNKAVIQIAESQRGLQARSWVA